MPAAGLPATRTSICACDPLTSEVTVTMAGAPANAGLAAAAIHRDIAAIEQPHIHAVVTS